MSACLKYWTRPNIRSTKKIPTPNIDHIIGLVMILASLLRGFSFIILSSAFSNDNLIVARRRGDAVEEVFSAGVLDALQYGDKIIVLNNGKVILNDDKEVVYKEEKKIKSVGLELPFMVDLSNKLGYYGLVDDTILSMNEMVNHLWK